MPFEPTTTAEFLTNSSIMQKLLEQSAARQSIEQTRQLRASPEQAQRIFQDTLRSNQAHVEALQADAAAKIAETNRARRGVGAAPTPSQVAITRAPAVAPTPAPVSRGITHSLDRAVGAIRNRLPNSAAAAAAASTAGTIGNYAAGQMVLNDLGAGLGVGGLARNAKTILDLMRKNNDSSNADPIPQINSPTQTVLAPGSPGFQAGIGYGVYVVRNADGVRMNAGAPFSGIGPVSWSPTLILNSQGTPILNGINLSFSNVNFGALNYTYSAQGYSAEIFRLDGQPENLAPTEVPTPTPPIAEQALPSFPDATLGNLPEVNRIPITQPVSAPLPVSDPAPDTGATPASDATPQNVPSRSNGLTTAIATGAAAIAVGLTTNLGPGLQLTGKPKDATTITPIIPPTPPPPTTTPTPCPCNAPVLNKLDGLQAGLDAADLALLGLIKADTGKIRTGTGVDLFPSSIPAHLNGKSGASRNLSNLADQNLWIVEALDSVLGAYPNRTSVTGADGSVNELLGDSISDDLAEIKGMLMGLTIDSSEILHTASRTLLQAGSATQQAHLAQRYAQANAEFLGYQGSPRPTEIPLTYTPGANPFEGLLTESKAKIQGWQNEDKQDLKGIFLELLQAAAIIRAVYWRRLNPREDFGTQIKQNIRQQSAGIDTVGQDQTDDWAQYLERVEQGFSAQTGDQTPYGRDQTERPRIRDVGGDNGA